ncbi:HNH endonuclease signature motif containing protein [Rhodococcus sp. BGS-1C]|uniref:HNH endonuclease signature motif containing protein n=1 Tax=Rhodococcus sp. BGS-1C TaxID=2100132 RepID=UPI003DA0BAC4
MCGRPAQWCQIHHVTYWNDGGATDLNNLALLCTECHRDIHNTDWQLAMGEDGHPHSIPPPKPTPNVDPSPATTGDENTPPSLGRGTALAHTASRRHRCGRHSSHCWK